MSEVINLFGKRNPEELKKCLDALNAIKETGSVTLDYNVSTGLKSKTELSNSYYDKKLARQKAEMDYIAEQKKKK